MLTYHPSDSSDIEVLFALNRTLIGQYEDPSSINLPEVLSWVRRKLEKKISEYRTAFLDGEKVGYFHLCEVDGGLLEIDDLYVLAPYQGKGVGTEIVLHCIAESERLKKSLMLYVFTENVRAVHLYEKLGFEVKEIVSPTRRILIRRA